MSTEVLADKIGIYFSTMSPLAAKIFSDIQGVEETIIKGSQNLTYSDRCSILDKHLIYDLVHNGINKDGDYNPTNPSDMDYLDKEIHNTTGVFHNDAVLDQDHVSALLLSVYPKKPEKYVYDDNNYWIDEHSVSYSCCTSTQANVCKLTDFVKALPVPQTQNTPPTCLNKKYKAPAKPPSPVENFDNDYQSDYESDEESNKDLQEIDSSQTIVNERLPHKKPSGIIGVSVMGGPTGPPKPMSFSSGSKQIEIEAQFENNLPQQKQNLDLIAELQAKLKMNKSTKENTTSQAASGISGHKAQINKPKAPPPPPPKVPGTAVQVDTTKDQAKAKRNVVVLSERKDSTTSNSTEEGRKSRKVNSEDDFIVDISSPCRIVTPKTGFDFLDNW